jgi:hypothetical protein
VTRKAAEIIAGHRLERTLVYDARRTTLCARINVTGEEAARIVAL